MDKETMFWLFTTAPQAIAALVGIICTGMFYIAGNIDNKAKDNPSLFEIAEEAKKSLYDEMQTVVILSVITIVYDIVLISFAPTLDIKNSCKSIVFFLLFVLLNLSSVIYTVKFVFQTIDPNSFDRIAKEISDTFTPGDVDQLLFLSHYMEFERIARRFNLQTKTNSIREIIHIMASMGVINKDDEKALFEITTIRNVIAHGQYDKNVDRSADEQLKKITTKIKKHIEDNNPQ